MRSLEGTSTATLLLSEGHSKISAANIMTDISLGADFFDAVKHLEDQKLKVRWYYSVVINLAAMNYPEIIPQVWQHCWEHVCEPLDHKGRFAVAQKVREALAKGCGIMGPAKVRTISSIDTHPYSLLMSCVRQAQLSDYWDDVSHPS